MLNKLLAVAALAGTGALVAATATHPTTVSPTAPTDNVGAVLQRYDLSPVLRTLPGNPTGSAEPMNGFFGADRYRIELVVTKVQRDSKQPGRYQVWGKDRFKGKVTPFAGTITLTDARLTQVPEDPGEASGYSASGTYELRETASPGAGTFRGRIAVDFGATPSGQLDYYPGGKGLTNHGIVLYDGTWTSAAGQVKPAIWVADIWSYSGPEVFQNFIIGGRNVHFNPKYAKLGWNNYWQNDEWWADTRPVAKQSAKRKL